MLRVKWLACSKIKIGKSLQLRILLRRNRRRGAPATAIKSTIIVTIWSKKELRCWNNDKCEIKLTNRSRCSKIESNYSCDKKQIRKRRLNCSRFKTCLWPKFAKKPNNTRIKMRWEGLMMIYSIMSANGKLHRSEIIESLADIIVNSSLSKTGSCKDKRWNKRKKIEESRFAWFNQLFMPKTLISSIGCGWGSIGNEKTP